MELLSLCSTALLHVKPIIHGKQEGLSCYQGQWKLDEENKCVQCGITRLSVGEPQVHYFNGPIKQDNIATR